MNWDRIQGNWKQMTGKLKEKWGKLTDDEFDQMAGNRDQLVGKIQERYGVARDEAERHGHRDEDDARLERRRELVQQHAAGEERERRADPREERALVREREAVVGVVALVLPRRSAHRRPPRLGHPA